MNTNLFFDICTKVCLDPYKYMLQQTNEDDSIGGVEDTFSLVFDDIEELRKEIAELREEVEKLCLRLDSATSVQLEWKEGSFV